MKNPGAQLPIGVFDSGIGGISVLSEIIRVLPCEEFMYFADTLHAPYGTKQEGVVRSLTVNAAEYLSHMGIKSLVVACNTATSVAIKEVRKICPFPVIGMEPALKPAVELKLAGKILVMATPLTLKGKKFHDLARHYKHLAEIIPLPCAGLVEIIERDHPQGQEIKEYLSQVFSPVNRKGISAIVLGCTHYVLIKKEIVNLVGRGIPVIDGNHGTARHLRSILHYERLLNGETEGEPRFPLRARIRFYISGNEREVVIARCKQLLQNEGIVCE